VTNGATVSVVNGAGTTIAANPSSTGSITVDGANSTLLAGNTLTLGQNNGISPLLKITNGGTVLVGLTSSPLSSGGFAIGAQGDVSFSIGSQSATQTPVVSTTDALMLGGSIQLKNTGNSSGAPNAYLPNIFYPLIASNSINLTGPVLSVSNVAFQASSNSYIYNVNNLQGAAHAAFVIPQISAGNGDQVFLFPTYLQTSNGGVLGVQVVDNSSATSILSSIKKFVSNLKTEGLIVQAIGGLESVLALVPQLAPIGGELLAAEPELLALGKSLQNVPNPPDPPPSLPTLAPGGQISSQLALTINSLLQNQFEVAGLFNRMLAYPDEIQTDIAAFNVPGAYSLLSQFELDEAELEPLLRTDATLASSLPDLLNAAGFQDVSVSQADLSSYLKSLGSQGFPSEELQIFEELGLTPTEIQDLANSLGELDLTGASLSLYSSFDQLSQIDTSIAEELPDLLQQNAVPEPSSLAIFGSGLFILTMYRRRKARASIVPSGNTKAARLL
jgi:T5SS/PEP-CTERM-associated repeat protein